MICSETGSSPMGGCLPQIQYLLSVSFHVGFTSFFCLQYLEVPSLHRSLSAIVNAAAVSTTQRVKGLTNHPQPRRGVHSTYHVNKVLSVPLPRCFSKVIRPRWWLTGYVSSPGLATPYSNIDGKLMSTHRSMRKGGTLINLKPKPDRSSPRDSVTGGGMGRWKLASRQPHKQASYTVVGDTPSMTRRTVSVWRSCTCIAPLRTIGPGPKSRRSTIVERIVIVNTGFFQYTKREEVCIYFLQGLDHLLQRWYYQSKPIREPTKQCVWSGGLVVRWKWSKGRRSGQDRTAKKGEKGLKKNEFVRSHKFFRQQKWGRGGVDRDGLCSV